MKSGPAESDLAFIVQGSVDSRHWFDCEALESPKAALFRCFDLRQAQTDRAFRAVMRLTCVISPENPHNGCPDL